MMKIEEETIDTKRRATTNSASRGVASSKKGIHEPPKSEPDEHFDHTVAHHTMNSWTLLNQIKPVQRMRAEWESRMNEAKEKSAEDARFLTSKGFSVNEKRLQKEVKVNSEVIHLKVTESGHFSISKGYSSDASRSLRNATFAKEQIRNPDPKPVIEVSELEKTARSTRDGSKGSGKYRDSYIESETIKKLLRDDENDKFKTPTDSQNLNIQEHYDFTSTIKEKATPGQTSDTKRNQATGVPLCDNSASLLSYFQKWRGYRRVIRLEPNPGKHVKLDVSNPTTMIQESVESDEKSMKESSEAPVLRSEPLKSWWDWSSNTGSKLDKVPSISGKSQIPKLDWIEDDTRSSKDQRRKIAFFTDKELRLLNEDFDKIVKSWSKKGRIELKNSQLKNNASYERMKTISQTNLSNRNCRSITHNDSLSSQAAVPKSSHLLLPDKHCQLCKILIGQGHIDGPNVMSTDGYYWHTYCFKCDVCDIQLNENNVFVQYSQLYCMVHYAQKIEALKCADCQHYIFEEVYTEAKGKAWHKNHFKCDSCEKAIIDAKFELRYNGKVICFDCHQRDFSYNCDSCQKRIHPTEQFLEFEATGNYWHDSETCFQCGACHQHLVSESTSNRMIFVKNGTPYCNAYCVQMANSI